MGGGFASTQESTPPNGVGGSCTEEAVTTRGRLGACTRAVVPCTERLGAQVPPAPPLLPPSGRYPSRLKHPAGPSPRPAGIWFKSEELVAWDQTLKPWLQE